MNVLLLAPKFDNGGIEKLAEQWEEEAKKNGINYIFCTYLPGGTIYERLTQKGYQVISLKRVKDIGIFKFISQIRKVAKDNNVEVSHINVGPITWITLLGLIMAGVKKRILHAHTTAYVDDNGKKVGIIIYMLSVLLNNLFSTRNIACSSEAGNYCFGKGKYQLIRNGIDTEKFAYDMRTRERVRRNYDIDDNTIVLGFVGRLEQQKNPLFLIDVFSEVCKKQENNFLLMIVGDGILRTQIENRIEQYDLMNKVIFCGILDDVASVYQAMDIFILTSFYEGLVISAVEAQCSGLPAILSDAMSPETRILDSARFVNINAGADVWADCICETVCTDRHDCSHIVSKAGYEMQKTRNQIYEMYIE